MLHTFHDGSKLRMIKVNELVCIPIWRGNRHIDILHANRIKEAIGSNIESLDVTVFRIIQYKDGQVIQRFIIDGQHRLYAIKNYLEKHAYLPDFSVLLIEKEVADESEAIEYFNMLNNVKPQHASDPRLMTNKYIQALEAQFNKSKKRQMIRPEGKGAKRPYLSSDALRAGLETHADSLRQSKDAITQFINNVVDWNNKECAKYELQSLMSPVKEQSILTNCLEHKFMLAFDRNLPWIKECLSFV